MDEEVKTKDIIKIIQACRAQGVKKFTYKGMEMEFDHPNSWNPTIVQPNKFAKMSDKEFNTVKDEGDVLSTMERLEDIQDFLHIEDPLGFEQAIIEKELINEET